MLLHEMLLKTDFLSGSDFLNGLGAKLCFKILGSSVRQDLLRIDVKLRVEAKIVKVVVGLQLAAENLITISIHCKVIEFRFIIIN